MAEQIFGEIAGCPPGTSFATRRELALSGVHRPQRAGISGSAGSGADSVILSGGYEDDLDLGDTILYTGHGGRDPLTGEQVGDQLLTRGNLALARSRLDGLPVRVVRGAGPHSPFAPGSGYRYDGLFRVEDHWRDRGLSGHTIWRFRLATVVEAGQRATARDTAQARQVKALYEHRCQACGVRLEAAAGPHAEAAHIRPLEAPHRGPDTLDNLLCLCPNHRALFAFGAIAVDDDLTLLGMLGRLTLAAGHRIDVAHLRYHRAHYFMGI